MNKIICDSCGVDVEKWGRIISCDYNGVKFTITTLDGGEHFCIDCLKKMLKAGEYSYNRFTN